MLAPTFREGWHLDHVSLRWWEDQFKPVLVKTLTSITDVYSMQRAVHWLQDCLLQRCKWQHFAHKLSEANYQTIFSKVTRANFTTWHKLILQDWESTKQGIRIFWVPRWGPWLHEQGQRHQGDDEDRQPPSGCRWENPRSGLGSRFQVSGQACRVIFDDVTGAIVVIDVVYWLFVMRPHMNAFQVVKLWWPKYAFHAFDQAEGSCWCLLSLQKQMDQEHYSELLACLNSSERLRQELCVFSHHKNREVLKWSSKSPCILK